MIPFYRYESEVAEHSNTADVLDAEELNQVEMLEDEFMSVVDVEYALATSSGTAALHLAMLALDLKRGDKIVCSVNTHPAVPEVVRHFDAEPVFVDIDDSYHIDIDKLLQLLELNESKKLKAVIVSLIGGANTDLEKIYSIANDNDVKVVLDATDCFGSTYKGDKLGSKYCDIACFDFSPHLKPSATKGGMFVTNDEELYTRAKLLENHGMKKGSDELEYIYDVIDVGNDYKMGELDAAFFRANLLRVEKNIQRLKEIANIYNQELKDVNHIELTNINVDDFPYLLYIIKIDKNRDSFALELKKEGIECGLHYIPLNMLTYYKNKYSLRINDFPKALRAYQQVLSLPCYASLTDDDVKKICQSIKKVAKNRV